MNLSSQNVLIIHITKVALVAFIDDFAERLANRSQPPGQNKYVKKVKRLVTNVQIQSLKTRWLVACVMNVL